MHPAAKLHGHHSGQRRGLVAVALHLAFAPDLPVLVLGRLALTETNCISNANLTESITLRAPVTCGSGTAATLTYTGQACGPEWCLGAVDQSNWPRWLHSEPQQQHRPNLGEVQQ